MGVLCPRKRLDGHTHSGVAGHLAQRGQQGTAVTDTKRRGRGGPREIAYTPPMCLQTWREMLRKLHERDALDLAEMLGLVERDGTPRAC